ncbi:MULTISPECIES: FAD-dependent oxidoreductase [Niastella]|uniref:FAD-dependent oxidoreductase n=1 Tax=Niastella soli TaxID=2821487 RepID=A0ABS3Z2J5_9BACT|nr:FAD-dependent oxidoreductase [Niastella soli]MBO9204354.1 FAD-dependent oxidoreductase [Niastella soli]
MIKRDGALPSLWQQTVNPLDISNTAPDTKYDVIIVGAGITGISLAHRLQSAGLQCLVLEAHSCCFGTTGGTTAHLNTLLDTPYTTIIKNFGEENAKLVAQGVKEAVHNIEKNIEKYQIACGFERTAAYLFAQDDDQQKELQDIVESCEKVSVPVHYTNTIPVNIPFIKAIEIPSQAKFSPVKYVYELAKAFIDAGGQLIEQTAVVTHAHRTDEVTSEEIIEVQTDTDLTYVTNALVYATHIPPGVNVLHLRCAPYRSYAMAVKLPLDNYPAELCYDMVDPYHYYRTQVIDGEPYFIAGGEDHKTGHEENTTACFNRLEAHVRKYFNVESITHKWSSQYYEPADGLPYIGELPGARPNVFVATGYGGNGMVYSQVATILLSDLILTGASAYKDVFDPNRVKPVAGFANFIKENADVVKNLVSGLVTRDQLESLSDLAHGDGKVVVFDKHKIALYKDPEGNLHVLNPTCTHLKCGVTWNAAELSWDCPCHGARYSIDGDVLNGPANMDLKKIDLKED